jgi:hypothetical protein
LSGTYPNPQLAKLDFFRTNSTTFNAIPANGSPAANIGSLTFTPRSSGNALVMARGYCNMNEGTSDLRIDLGIGKTATDAFGSLDVQNWGVLAAPTGSDQLAMMYTAQKLVPVTAGTATTLSVWGQTEFATTGSADCSVQITAETVY